jgi:hypothetical protein
LFAGRPRRGTCRPPPARRPLWPLALPSPGDSTHRVRPAPPRRPRSLHACLRTWDVLPHISLHVRAHAWPRRPRRRGATPRACARPPGAAHPSERAAARLPRPRARRVVPDPSSRGLRGHPLPPGARRAAPARPPFTVPPAPGLDVTASPWQVAPRPAVADHSTNGSCRLPYYTICCCRRPGRPPLPAAARPEPRARPYRAACRTPAPTQRRRSPPAARPEPRAPLSRSVPHPRPRALPPRNTTTPAAPGFFSRPPASKPSPHNANTPERLAWVSPSSLLCPRFPPSSAPQAHRARS